MKKFIAVVAILTLATGTAFARNAYGRTPAQTKAVLDQSETNVTAIASNLSRITTNAAVIVTNATAFNEVLTYLGNGLLIDGTLTISATADQFKTTTSAIYTVAGVNYTKTATDSLEFTLADTINTGAAATNYWGIWQVQIDIAGTVSTKAGGGSADQLYTSGALAIAALPAVDAANVSLGYILVAASTNTFTCNTTDLTTIGTFVDTAVKTLPSSL